MPPRPPVTTSRPCERAAEVLPGALGERLVGALQDALRADVDPRAGRHLAVHREPERFEPAELVPGRPARHQVRVGDQHPRRLLVGPEHADRLPALDQQRLVVLQPPERGHDRARSTPSCAPPCRRRRRRSAPPAARRPRDRGCSSASAAPPPGASPCRRGWSRVGAVMGHGMGGGGHGWSDGVGGRESESRFSRSPPDDRARASTLPLPGACNLLAHRRSNPPR